MIYNPAKKTLKTNKGFFYGIKPSVAMATFASSKDDDTLTVIILNKSKLKKRKDVVQPKKKNEVANKNSKTDKKRKKQYRGLEYGTSTTKFKKTLGA